MEKLNPNQLQDIFKDVRSAYRILALYQQRILDTVKYVGNQYGFSFQSGWSKFSNAASHGNRATIHKKWSWDWLTQYLYEFNMGVLEVEQDKFYFKILHQADTGFYDANEMHEITKLNIDQFADEKKSQTRLFFIVSKNEDGCPIQHFLKDNLTKDSTGKILNGNWLAKPYDISRFVNQESADVVLTEFNALCKDTFGIDLLSKNIN
ncbi:hypothetical protein [Mesoflavibacter sp. CH_XMU1422-2]|uniref:hypothetical protein n=1 Tax=Mesoflavibacter sp. CH_XMU1422-2 TaxID=3107770 RepID=UPI0030081ACE